MLNPLSVNEIFASIQGEGAFSGLGMVFIRFTGCNLRCEWCDTKKAWLNGDFFSPEGILNELSPYQIKSVCLTGGEPLFQDMDSIKYLCNLLHKHNYTIHLETNGTYELPAHRFFCFDFIIASPKRDHSITESVKSQCHYYKFIISGLDDIAWVEWFLQANELSSLHTVFLQPVDNDRNIARLCADAVMCHSNWRVGMQLHKTLGLR